MSYLVEALRKAEHERRQGLSAGVTALSPQQSHTPARDSNVMGWGIAVLVVCNLLLLGFLLWPGGQQQPQPQPDDPVVAASTIQNQMPVTTARADAGSLAAVAANGATMPDVDANYNRRRLPLYDGQSTSGQNGRKTAAKHVPDPPAVHIQGHLYSSNPAESFVLVDGHVYHEGELLPDGVGIMRIDDQGALLDYQGQRFHVNGPG